MASCRICKTQTGQTAFSEEPFHIRSEIRKRMRDALEDADPRPVKKMKSEEVPNPSLTSKPHLTSSSSSLQNTKKMSNAPLSAPPIWGKKPNQPKPSGLATQNSGFGNPKPHSKNSDSHQSHKEKKKKKKESIIKSMLREQEAKQQQSASSKNSYQLSQFLKPI